MLADAAGHQAIAIVLDLVNPSLASRRLQGFGGEAGMERRGHEGGGCRRCK
jgi:hypothetical protein